MSAASHEPVESEPTPIGEQMLVPGVSPVSVRERLQVLAAAPPEFGPKRLYANLGRAAGQDDNDVYAVIWNPAD